VFNVIAIGVVREEEGLAVRLWAGREGASYLVFKNAKRNGVLSLGCAAGHVKNVTKKYGVRALTYM
jgi:hypothetical protein